MIRTQLYIPEELYAQAKLLAQLDGVSISEYVREGLLLKVKSREKGRASKHKAKKASNPLSALVGAFSTGSKRKIHAAITHNDIYDYVIPAESNHLGTPVKKAKRRKKH